MHLQLEELWRTNRTLSEWRSPQYEFDAQTPASDAVTRLASGGEELPLVDLISSKTKKFGYSFVPLASKHLYLSVKLDILLLRRDVRGGAVHHGDLDNRVKTLVDCLRMPQTSKEADDASDHFNKNQGIFCLMEDDKQLSKLSIETSALLRPPNVDEADADVDIVMKVGVTPYLTTKAGLAFLS